MALSFADRRTARRADRRAAARARVGAASLVAAQTAAREVAEAQAARFRDTLVRINDAVANVGKPNGTTRMLGRLAAEALVDA